MRVPTEIDATGRDDVTAALNSFLETVPRGATVEFPETGRYRCEGPVTLGAKTGVTLDCAGSLLFATTRAYRERSHWRIASCRDITMIRPHVHGANPHSGLDAAAYDQHTEGQHGIEILQSMGVTILDPDIRSVYGDFVAITRKNPHKPWSSWVRIERLVGRDNGRIGVSVTAGSVVEILDVDLDRMRRSVLNCEPDSSSDGAHAVTLNGGRIGRAHTGYILASLGKAGLVSDITVKNLRAPNHGITVQVVSLLGERRSKRNIQILGNTSGELLERTPMRFTRVDGVTVRGNVQPLRPGVELVATTDCTGVRIG